MPFSIAPQPGPGRHGGRGLTLVELITVLAILAVLAALALPAFQGIGARLQQESASSALMSHLTLARSAAVTRRTRVALVASAEGWGGGWRVHVDANANGVWDAGEAVLAESGPLKARVRAGNPMARHVAYDALGHPVQPNGAFLAGSFTVCAAGAADGQRLVLSAVGRLRSEAASGACRDAP